MSLQIRITTDTLTPDLRARIVALRNPHPLLAAIGRLLVGLTKRAWRDDSLRAAPWPPKADGTPATLYKHGVLWNSIRVTADTANSVTIGSDRPYAAVHQLGSPSWNQGIRIGGFKTILRGPHARTILRRGTPARPFFPVTPTGRLLPLADNELRRLVNRYFDRHA